MCACAVASCDVLGRMRFRGCVWLQGEMRSGCAVPVCVGCPRMGVRRRRVCGRSPQGEEQAVRWRHTLGRRCRCDAESRRGYVRRDTSRRGVTHVRTATAVRPWRGAAGGPTRSCSRGSERPYRCGRREGRAALPFTSRTDDAGEDAPQLADWIYDHSRFRRARRRSDRPHDTYNEGRTTARTAWRSGVRAHKNAQRQA